ncbi:MAG: hypothetical protein ACREFX_07200, partial [Opitutaceae bacterium]
MAFALPALLPVIAGFAAPEIATGLGAAGIIGTGLATTLGTGIGADLLGAGAGALTGGLMQHSALGALEGAAGGFGGSLLTGPINAGVSGLSSAIGGSTAPLGAMGQDVLNPAVLSAAPTGVGTDIAGAAGNIVGGVTGSGAGFGVLGPGAAPLTGFDTTAGNAITGAAGAASGAGSAAGSALPSLLPMGAQGAAALLSGNPALGQQAGGPLGSAGQDVVNPSYLASPGAAPAPALTPTAAAPTQEGAPAGSSGGGATNAAGTGSGGSLDNFLKQISGVAPLALALGGMGANALMKPAIPGVNQGTSSINPQSALGQQLGIAQNVQGQIAPQERVASSLQATANPLVNAPVTGQLPPAVAASYQNQLANQITEIKSEYASLGEPGST